MKIKRKITQSFLGLMITCLFGLTSCENKIDNYAYPDGAIKGKVVDAATKEMIPLPVQGNAGVLVNLIEQDKNATQSIDFRAKQDGSFENTLIFNGSYQVVVNGPFVEPCQGTVHVNGTTELTLEATPYARLTLSGTIAGNNQVTLAYQIDKTTAAHELSEVTLLWNFAPGVDVNSSNYAGRVSLPVNTKGTGIAYDLSKDAQFMANRHKIKANKDRVYFRLASKVNGAINYSKVLELTVN